MTSRYGRNQRRAHRERIAQLEKEVRELRVGPWEEATGKYVSLDSMPIVRFEIVDREDKRRYIEKECVLDIVMENYNPLLMVIAEDHRPVEYRGIVWHVISTSVETQSYDWNLAPFVITLTLKALAPSRPSKRNPKAVSRIDVL